MSQFLHSLCGRKQMISKLELKVLIRNAKKAKATYFRKTKENNPYVRDADIKINEDIALTLFEKEECDPSLWHDYFDVSCFTYDPATRQVCVNAIVSLSYCVPEIFLRAAVYHCVTEEKLCEFDPKVSCYSPYNVMDARVTLDQEVNVVDLIGVVTASYYVYDKGIQEIDKVMPIQEPIHTFMSYLHELPKKRYTGFSAKYDRSYIYLINKEVSVNIPVDYDCSQERSGDVLMHLPIKGKLILKEAYEFAEDIRISCVLRRVDSNKSGARKLTYDGKESILLSAQGKQELTLDIDKGFEILVDKCRKCMRAPQELYLALDIVLRNRHTQEIKLFPHIMITSHKENITSLYNELLTFLFLK